MVSPPRLYLHGNHELFQACDFSLNFILSSTIKRLIFKIQTTPFLSSTESSAFRNLSICEHKLILMFGYWTCRLVGVRLLSCPNMDGLKGYLTNGGLEELD